MAGVKTLARIKASGAHTPAELRAKDPGFKGISDAELQAAISEAYLDQGQSNAGKGPGDQPSFWMDKVGAAGKAAGEELYQHPAATVGSVIGTGAGGLAGAPTGPGAIPAAMAGGAAGSVFGNEIDNLIHSRPIGTGAVGQGLLGATGPLVGGVIRAAPTAARAIGGRAPWAEVGKTFTRGAVPWIKEALELAPEGAAARMLERLVMESPEEAAALARQAPQNFALESGTKAGAPARRYLEERIGGAKAAGSRAQAYEELPAAEKAAQTKLADQKAAAASQQTAKDTGYAGRKAEAQGKFDQRSNATQHEYNVDTAEHGFGEAEKTRVTDDTWLAGLDLAQKEAQQRTARDTATTAAARSVESSTRGAVPGQIRSAAREAESRIPTVSERLAETMKPQPKDAPPLSDAGAVEKGIYGDIVRKEAEGISSTLGDANSLIEAAQAKVGGPSQVPNPVPWQPKPIADPVYPAQAPKPAAPYQEQFVPPAPPEPVAAPVLDTPTLAYPKPARGSADYARDAENLQGLLPQPSPERSWIGNQWNKYMGPSSTEQGQTMNRWFQKNLPGFNDDIAKRDLAQGVPAGAAGGTAQSIGIGALDRLLAILARQNSPEQFGPEEAPVPQEPQRFRPTPGRRF